MPPRIPGHIKRLGNLADVDIAQGINFERTKLDTEQATTSGTSKTFTSPFGTTTAFRLMIDGVSLSGATDQIGAQLNGENSGYTGGVRNLAAAGAEAAWSGAATMTTGNTAASLWTGTLTGILMDATNNTWILHSDLTEDAQALAGMWAGGKKSLSAILSTVLLVVTGTPTDAFDAGAVNVRWYGY